MSKYIQAGGAAPGGLQAIAAGRSSEPVGYAAGGARAVATLTLGTNFDVATAAIATLTPATNFDADDTITVNGTVFTAVASGAAGPEFNIGGTLALSLAAFVIVLNASVVAGVALATYSENDVSLVATLDAAGTSGNAFTLATSKVDVTVTPTAVGGLNADTVTVNGTAFTAKVSGATGNQFDVGVSIAASLTALAVVLNASVVAGVAKATYGAAAAVLTATFDEGGAVGNDYTLASTADVTIVDAAGGADLVLGDSVYHYFDSSQAVDQYYDLAEGDEGTRRVVALRTKSGAGGAIVRADFDGGTTINLGTVGEYAVLEYVIGQWVVVKNTGDLA